MEMSKELEVHLDMLAQIEMSVLSGNERMVEVNCDDCDGSGCWNDSNRCFRCSKTPGKILAGRLYNTVAFDRMKAIYVNGEDKKDHLKYITSTYTRNHKKITAIMQDFLGKFDVAL